MAARSSDRRKLGRRGRLAASAALLAILPAAAQVGPGGDSRDQADSLRRQVATLEGKERGILGELERLDAELRVRRSAVEEADARIGTATTEVDQLAAELTRLSERQSDRRRYLAFRLREVYKRGAAAPLRLLAGGEASAALLRSARYAAYLGERDIELIQSFRSDADRLTTQTREMIDRRRAIEADRAVAEEARRKLAAAREERAQYLAVVRKDLGRSREALRELEGAARGLGNAASAAPARPAPAVDPAQLRGHLEWPVPGKVRAGFGSTVHPEFKTAVPHPGLDLEAAEGTDIRAAADGTVVWSGSLRGYGLTAIVDHGGGLLSVYAHAAVLLAEAGDRVLSGEVVGKVGDTGSLKGAYLYFELRRDGKPIDPLPWLRRR